MSNQKRHEEFQIDGEKARHAVRDLLEALGYDTNHSVLKDTPKRVVDSLVEMTTARDFEISFFENENAYSEPLLITDIPFVSLCEHHLLPFRGVAHIGYVPGNKLIGLSVLPYVVEKFAHALQLQETMTEEIADYLAVSIEAKGIAVLIEADHMCMQARGVRSASAKTVTTAFRGELKNDELFRIWFYNSMRGSAQNEAHSIDAEEGQNL